MRVAVGVQGSEKRRHVTVTEAVFVSAQPAAVFGPSVEFFDTKWNPVLPVFFQNVQIHLKTRNCYYYFVENGG